MCLILYIPKPYKARSLVKEMIEFGREGDEATVKLQMFIVPESKGSRITDFFVVFPDYVSENWEDNTASWLGNKHNLTRMGIKDCIKGIQVDRFSRYEVELETAPTLGLEVWRVLNFQSVTPKDDISLAPYEIETLKIFRKDLQPLRSEGFYIEDTIVLEDVGDHSNKTIDGGEMDLTVLHFTSGFEVTEVSDEKSPLAFMPIFHLPNSAIKVDDGSWKATFRLPGTLSELLDKAKGMDQDIADFVNTKNLVRDFYYSYDVLIPESRCPDLKPQSKMVRENQGQFIRYGWTAEPMQQGIEEISFN